MKNRIACFVTIVSICIMTNSSFASNATSTCAMKFVAAHLFEEDEISVSYTYLSSDGYTYGAHCYLVNNTGLAVNVHWTMPDHYNISSSSGSFEGDEYISGYGTVEIITVSSINSEDGWSTGTVYVNY